MMPARMNSAPTPVRNRPANDCAVEEQDADAEQERQQRDAEAPPVAAEEPEVPEAAVDRDLIHQQVTADDDHDDAEEECAHSARRAPDVLHVHL